MDGLGDVLRFTVILTTTILIPGGTYVGYRYAMMWLKRYEREGELQAGLDPETQGRLQQLEADVADLHERLDFAERLLARQREAEQLAPGSRALES